MFGGADGAGRWGSHASLPVRRTFQSGDGAGDGKVARTGGTLERTGALASSRQGRGVLEYAGRMPALQWMSGGGRGLLLS